MGNDISVYPRLVAKYIWETEKGFFTYIDETERFADRLYESVADAQAALAEYVTWLG